MARRYADYSFYVDEYHGKMDEADFQRHILAASQYIKYLTKGRSDEYDGGDEVKYAACESADVLYSVSLAFSGQGQKKSENTDGYSVSYVTQGKDGETSEELSNRKMNEVIRKWLLPTGLLYAGARCGHVNQYRYHNL